MSPEKILLEHACVARLRREKKRIFQNRQRVAFFVGRMC